ncbi:MAG: hypothetical protein K2J87_07080, partial [Muribaculaceae bacterium]|nr:hypothetical protein [Muribaculaceae bacterium]
SLKGEIAELRAAFKAAGNDRHNDDSFFKGEHSEKGSRFNALMKLPPEEIIPTEDFSVQTQPDTPLSQSVDATEKEAIRNALERNKGNKKAAAEELGISLRTIYRKISEFELDT